MVTATVGVGLVEAAAGAARAIQSVRPRTVLFVGTAGLYPGTRLRIAIEDAAIATRMRLLSHAVLRRHSYLPDPMPSVLKADTSITGALARATGLPIADIACPLGITRDPSTARRASRVAALENLEAFAVASAAATAQVPFAAILGVSNNVGRRAHAEWKRHGAAAAASACQAIARWLDRAPLGASASPRR